MTANYFSKAKIRFRSVRLLVAALVLVCVVVRTAAADEASSTNAVSSNLVKQANAPISTILQIRFQDSYSPAWQGVHGQGNAFSIAVTAPLPEFRLLPFPQLSLLKIPAAITLPSGQTEFGDVSFLDLAIFRAGNNFVFGFGPTFTFPTANAPTAGQGKWQVGPGAAFAWSPRRWLIGVLAQNPISVAGDSNRASVDQLFLQPFISWQFNAGWFVRSEPQLVFDWETHQRLLPVNLGFGRVFPIGKQIVSIFVEPGWNIAHDGPAPRYFINFGAILLYPNFWGTR